MVFNAWQDLGPHTSFHSETADSPGLSYSKAATGGTNENVEPSLGYLQNFQRATFKRDDL